MRAATPFRLLLVPAALLAAGCDDSPSPQEPIAMEEAAPAHSAGAALPEAAGRWADGYLWAFSPSSASYTPLSSYSFNGSGGPMTVTKVAGTTGRYVARFSGLSALLGTKNTVRVSGFGNDATYCKPVGARLVRDSVEVRCYRMGTGAAANTRFTVLVTRDYADRAFAYAHQPTAASYSPAAAGSSNPAGTTTVARLGAGHYQVSFRGLGNQLPSGVGGHVQVNAVGTSKAHCKAYGAPADWDVIVYVQCYTPSGAPVDSKFTVLFTQPAAHLAYAFAEQASAAKYSPHAVYRSSPADGLIEITHDQTGSYEITWGNVDSHIIDEGSMQVMAYGQDGAHCKPNFFGGSSVSVVCFAANGTLVDTRFMVLFHS